MRRLTPLALLFALTSVGATRSGSSIVSSDLIVHEWGTFTSIAGQDGAAVRWSPLDGAQDLPCFVDRHPLCVKCMLTGTVRMETPVLYFYAPHDTAVRVGVEFPEGVITESYPTAVTPAPIQINLATPLLRGSAKWSEVMVQPGEAEAFPSEDGKSHYYAARDTDAAPLTSGSQHEKFLFYRGLGQFQPPLRASVKPDGSVDVSNPDGTPLGDLILFENRGGSTAYEVVHVGASAVTSPALVLEGESVTPTAELERILIAHGLYAKEAKAMIATWRDSWFEEGTRLIYIAPRAAVDAILPLTIDPKPAAIERVFVGRIELPTAATLRDVRSALLKDDRTILTRYGRFLRPFAERILAESSPADATLLQQNLRAAATWMAAPVRCR
jgi:hypothetical protein